MTRYSDADLILNNDGSIYHLNLKPENVAEDIILVGDPERVARISRHFSSIEFETQKREFLTHTGIINQKRVTVMSTGMGVDNIEIAMIELDALFNIDLNSRLPLPDKKSINLIRIGTSGAIHEEVHSGSEVISQYGIGLDNLIHYYQLEQSDRESELGNNIANTLDLPQIPYVVKGSETLIDRLGHGFLEGNTVTTPGFYGPQGRRLRLAVNNPQFLEKIRSFNFNNFRFTNFEMETSSIYAFARLLGHEAISINAILGNRSQGTFAKDPYKTIDSVIEKVLSRL